MRTLQGLCAALTILLLGAAIGVMSMTPPDYTLARSCVIASAVALALLAIFWEVNTDEVLWVRLLLGIVAGSIIVGGTPEAIRYINYRENELPLEAKYVLANLSSLPNGDLRTTVYRLTKEMYNFEEKITSESYTNLIDEFLPKDATEAQRAQLFRRRAERELKRSATEGSEFRRLYLSRAIPIYAELKSRLSGMPNIQFKDENLLPALSGMLAGVHPVSELANYLEYLASKLPES